MSVSLEQLLKMSASQATSAMYTALPCRILTVHDGLKDLRIDVQPLVNATYSDGTSEEHTPILSVPVVFPSSSTSMVSFPLHVGDMVLCVFTQQGLDNFKRGAGLPLDAPDYRKFDARDAIAIPSVVPFAMSKNDPAKRTWEHDTKDMVMAHNIGTGSEVEIRLQPSGNLVINTNQNVSLNCQQATVNAPSTIWNGDITMNGTFTLGGIVMNTHRHGGVQGGSSSTAGPQ